MSRACARPGAPETATNRALRPGQVDRPRSARSQYNTVPVPRITKEDLKLRLEGPEPPLVVDARLKYPYEHSTVKLPGALRYLAGGTPPSIPRDREVVVYDSGTAGQLEHRG